MFSASGDGSAKKTRQQEQYEDLRRYVLQLQDEMELAEGTLKRLTESMNRVIRKGEKKLPKYLMKLLEESSGFDGVEKFDSRLVPTLQSKEYQDCWSLPVITLTTIAISLPDIQKDLVKSLLTSVSEGLGYVKLVEESLNATEDYVSIQKAAETLWLQVESHQKWLDYKLEDCASEGNTTQHIVQWYKNTAKNMVTCVEKTDIGGRDDNAICTSICANSMYRITKTIMLSHDVDIDKVSQGELFAHLSSMISEILAACLTNLPQVIAMKCHESVIEKREKSVHAAAHFFGETKQIINNLQEREQLLPKLNEGELAFIDKWRAYLKQPSP